MTRIAVIGGGRIGEALIAGLLESGRASKDLVVVETFSERAELIANRFGVRVTNSATDAAVGADLVVVAVKPGDSDSVLTELGKAELGGDRDQVLVSLAAGVPTARLEAKMPAGFPVVRVMPNTPMLVGQGMSVLAPGRYARPEQLAQVTELLSSVGKVVTVAESQMDAVTAVSGSGPAYFFLVAEAMVDAGVGLGLTRDVGGSARRRATERGGAACRGDLPGGHHRRGAARVGARWRPLGISGGITRCQAAVRGTGPVYGVTGRSPVSKAYFSHPSQ
jgi:pyrroline-5-carboxylate reductase